MNAEQKEQLEQVVKAEFESDPKLVEEFGGDFEAYLAYKVAAAGGHVRILGGAVTGKEGKNV